MISVMTDLDIVIGPFSDSDVPRRACYGIYIAVSVSKP